VITKMEKRKAEMHVEERDRRAEELKNQMMNFIPEEVPSDEEIEPETEEIIEPVEEIIEEEPAVEEEVVEEEKVEKKDKTKQTTLFSF
ncbi:MAG: replication factor C large subunit, partial [Methanobrevibacter sp.]|nr:replication factor C large subunit [Methanobrevibacter sp.]